METFKITRIFTDNNGESRFEDIFYPVHDNGPLGYLSDRIKVNEIILRKSIPSYDNYKNTPQKQYVILLDGSIEIETSDNEKRTFSPGEVLLMEDTKGKGHKSRNIIPEIRHSLFIILHEQTAKKFEEFCL